MKNLRFFSLFLFSVAALLLPQEATAAVRVGVVIGSDIDRYNGLEIVSNLRSTGFFQLV